MFEDAIEHWRISKGRGTAIIPSNLDDRLMIQGVLQNLYNKNPTAKIVIVVKDFSDRTSIIEYLTTKTGDNCEEFEQLIVNKFIRVFTESFVINSDLSDVRLPQKAVSKKIAMQDIIKACNDFYLTEFENEYRKHYKEATNSECDAITNDYR